MGKAKKKSEQASKRGGQKSKDKRQAPGAARAKGSDGTQGKALGVGGIFFRSADPARLGDWYARHLGFDVESWGDTRGTSFSPAGLPENAFTVWSAFAADTAYFGNTTQSYMINLVVDDLEAALANVAAGGATVLEEREEHDFGRFGWFIDPDGHRVELWEPPSSR